MNVITTRTATSDDKDFLWELKVASMRQYVEAVYGWDDSSQYGFFELGFCPQAIQIIEYDRQDIGMYELRERDSDWFLARIEILPAFQGKGIGGTVIQQMVARVSKTGKPLRLQVFKVNPARKLYERIGFLRTGETKTHFLMELPNSRMPRTGTSSSGADA
jgi:ribosomal protein S18 acetylase RimI-like enzyme